MRTLAACATLVLVLILVPAARPSLPGQLVATHAAAAQPTSADGLVTYHYDLSRSGFDSGSPAFSGLSGHWSAMVDGDVYAEPLVYNGHVFTATQNDTVYSFNVGAPASVVWQKSIGTPHSGVYCGSNIEPKGIESTPVIDPATGTLYVVGVTGGNSPVFQLFGLNAATGAITVGPITLSRGAPDVNVALYQQRAALAFNNGRVYVSYAGWVGDCPPYKGTVQAVTVPAGVITEWQVPGGRGGIWGPGGPAIDPSGNVYVATGNDDAPMNSYGYGDSVVKLDSTATTPTDYFAPHDWHALAQSDTDLGGVGPVILGSSGLVFIGGKNGRGYLLNESSLGHIGADLAHDGLFNAPVCGGEILNGSAYAPPHLYVSCGGATYPLTVNESAHTFSVGAALSSCGTSWSPLVAGGVVWVEDDCGNLNGYSMTSGAPAFTAVNVGTANGPHFISPAASRGRVFTAMGMTVSSYLFSAPPPAGSYHAVNPTRLYDSRAVAPLGANSTRDIPVQALAGSLITSTPSAVVLNVAVTNPTSPSYLAVYPTGSPFPGSSTVNFGPTQTIANLSQVQVGSGGSVTVYNSQGSTDFFLDLAGWYDTGPPGGNVSGLFNALAAPKRVLDTRGSGQLGANSTRNVQITGAPTGIPATGASAVVMNVTAVNPTAPSYLTVYPTGPATRPGVSNVNFPANTVLPNRAIVAVSSGGSVTVYNSQGSLDVVIDVVGWFTNATPGGTGALFHPHSPLRLLDTRPASQMGQYATPWPANTARDVTVGGLAGTDPAATAVAANFTITDPDSGSFLTVYPTGALPQASDLNWGPGWTIANHVVAGLSGGSMRVYNNIGRVNVIVDVNGWYG